MLDLTQDEPTTVSEVHNTIGTSYNFSRDQVDTRMKQMAMNGDVSSKKPNERASRIFYSNDYSSNNNISNSLNDINIDSSNVSDYKNI